MSKKSPLVASALALAVSSAFAQEQPITVDSIAGVFETVVVMASKIEQQFQDVIPSVSVITREDIERTQAQDLPSLLIGEPGFEFGRNGGAGGTTSFYLRGADSVNSALFIDGVRAQTDRIGFFNSADIPLYLIERIEIIRGNLGAVHGEAAIGGAIHIFTKRYEKEPSGSVAVTVGSRNTKELSAGYGGKLGDYRLAIDATERRTDGRSARVGTSYNPDNDGYVNQGLNFRFSKNFSNATELGVFLTSFRGESDYDDSGASDTHRLDRSNDSYGIFLQTKPTDSWKTKLELSRSTLKLEDYLNGVQKTFLNGGLSEGDQNTLRWENDYRLTKSTRLTGGLETSTSDFSGRYYDSSIFGFARSDTSRDTKAAYIGVLTTVGRFELQANLRRDEIDAKQISATSIEANETSWLLGAGYWLADQVKVTAARSTAFRAPSPDEFVSVPTLQPENHKTDEIGLTYKNALFQTRLVRFISSSKNSIVYRSDTFDYENINIENNGWESFSSLMYKNWRAKLSLTAQDPRNVTVSNTRLARRARAFGSFELSYEHDSTTYGGRVYSSGSRKDSNFSSTVLAPYSTVDLYARYRLNKELVFGARIENLTNDDYQLANTYLTPGRGVFVSLSYQPRY